MSILPLFAWTFLLVLLGGLGNANAGETRQMYRGTRAMAMGNAYTAVADDEMAVFLNPAGMANNDGTKLHLFTGDLTGSTDWVSAVKEGSTAISKIDGDTLNLIIGKNLYGQGTFSPTLTMSNLGIAFLLDTQLALRAENKAMPNLIFGYQNTNGLQLSYGFTVGKKAAGGRKTELSLGIGAKMMWRRGGYRKLPLITLINLDRSSLGPIIGDYGKGYGLDLGSKYTYRLSQNLDLSAGLTYLDVGDTSFGEGPDPQPGNVTLGAAATYRLSAIKLIMAYDYKNILDETDSRKKSHLGMEIGLPFVSLLAGFNQVYYTYGATASFWMFKAAFASYGEEIGSFAYQDPERRYMARIQVSFDL